jgi:3-phosphoglycerate kinase
MKDGYGNTNLDFYYEYISDIENSELNVYDIGDKSSELLINLINENDIIFWFGSLGVIEHPYYIQGSKRIFDYIKENKSKKLIMKGKYIKDCIHENDDDYLLINDDLTKLI